MRDFKNNLRPFHLAIPVSDIEKSKKFYQDILECNIGRSTDNWIDFNLFGHQLVIHLSTNIKKANINKVDGYDIPVPHFGVILEWEQWRDFSNILKDKIIFVIEPYIRFKGKKGEQATMFFLDPDNNALEFKAFKHDSMIFEK
tara:strand:+ start:319 stop:747 length:429 start_codon:yes stop_codon:yes gene_type:complete